MLTCKIVKAHSFAEARQLSKAIGEGEIKGQAVAWPYSLSDDLVWWFYIYTEE